jgi:hypothetical protein
LKFGQNKYLDVNWKWSDKQVIITDQAAKNWTIIDENNDAMKNPADNMDYYIMYTDTSSQKTQYFLWVDDQNSSLELTISAKEKKDNSLKTKFRIKHIDGKLTFWHSRPHQKTVASVGAHPDKAIVTTTGWTFKD